MIKAISLNLPFVSRKSSFDFGAVLKLCQLLILLTALALFLLYIFQVNYYISERQSARQYRQELNKLALESKSLEINSLEANSLDNITSSLEGLGLERVNKTYYIRVLDTKVVTK